MALSYSIGRPAPGHRATVGRIHTGGRGRGGWSYGTTLDCECGAPMPGSRSAFDSKVSNSAPSAGGKADAQHAYKQHLEQVLGKRTISFERVSPTMGLPDSWVPGYDAERTQPQAPVISGDYGLVERLDGRLVAIRQAMVCHSLYLETWQVAYERAEAIAKLRDATNLIEIHANGRYS